MSATNVEVKYPIYHYNARWVEDGESDRYPWWPDDPGPGRIWNSTSTITRMYREDPGLEVVEAEAREWWNQYAEKRADRNPGDPVLEVKRGRDEEWCAGWFSHWTFDTGQTDIEVLDSFQRFVWRMEERNRVESEWSEAGYRLDAYCLMGAEDRWRWTARAGGTGALGIGENTGEAPCRCDGCKVQGIIRIDH